MDPVVAPLFTPLLIKAYQLHHYHFVQREQLVSELFYIPCVSFFLLTPPSFFLCSFYLPLS